MVEHEFGYNQYTPNVRPRHPRPLLRAATKTVLRIDSILTISSNNIYGFLRPLHL